MKRLFRFVIFIVTVLSSFGANTTFAVDGPKPARKPNIIFILADDLGYGDLGVTFQNARDPSKPRFTTPNLDNLAANGMLLQQHYCGSPVCVSSRASLLLGQHQGDCPIRDNQFDKALPKNHTLATVLKAAGYHTIAIGKWGLQGKSPEYTGHPLRHGFDEFFGFLAHMSGHVYYHDAGHPLHDGFNDVTSQYVNIYSTDLFTAKAKQFIADHESHSPDVPFFMYLAYTAPHNPQQIPGGPYPAGAGVKGGLQWPLQPTPDTRDTWYDPEYANATFAAAPSEPAKPWGERMKRYATVIHRLDQGVGDVMQVLQDLKIDDNTLVVFTSDNGPSQEGIDPRQFDSWGPFDGFKRDVWEGGVREPTIVAWPGRIVAGQKSPFVSSFWDWMPTFADVAGVVPPAQSDGVSLLPTLFGQGAQRSRGFIYEDYFIDNSAKPSGALVDVLRRKGVAERGVQQMLREGDFVAVRTMVRSADDSLRLYNVVTDPHQDHDLASDPQYADHLKQMREKIASVRRPDSGARRPYDEQPLPAVTEEATLGSINADIFEGTWPWVPDFDALQSVRRAAVNSIDASGLILSDHSGVRFNGYLKVPTDGIYTFWLTDDAGAQFWLHDAHVIDDDFNHDGSAAYAWIPLQAGLHPFHLFYRHQTGTLILQLEFAGPGIPRQPVPASALAARVTPVENHTAH